MPDVGFKSMCVIGYEGFRDCKNILRGEINFITSHFHSELIIGNILK